MIVKRAAVLGRCMGVRRAVDLALKTAAGEAAPEGRHRPVYTLGPLIHNPGTVAALEAKGIRVLPEGLAASPAPGAGSVIVIRAHGVPPELRERLAAVGAEIVDATCPRVLASQARARDYAARGWKVIIAGDRDHGEVAGIAGFAPGAAIVGSPEEAKAVAAGLAAQDRVALIAQTTIKKEEYLAIRDVLAAALPVLEVVESICPATEERLSALADLADDCDALVVVGGRNSANTTRLATTARALGRPTWLVEGAADLPPEVFAFERVGVTAGASTPDEAVEDVESALLSGGIRP
jgi:4-hydroxy-3-methylbut-2-enyl diphosphate reductase